MLGKCSACILTVFFFFFIIIYNCIYIYVCVCVCYIWTQCNKWLIRNYIDAGAGGLSADANRCDPEEIAESEHSGKTSDARRYDQETGARSKHGNHTNNISTRLYNFFLCRCSLLRIFCTSFLLAHVHRSCRTLLESASISYCHPLQPTIFWLSPPILFYKSTPVVSPQLKS